MHVACKEVVFESVHGENEEMLFHKDGSNHNKMDKRKEQQLRGRKRGQQNKRTNNYRNGCEIDLRSRHPSAQ